eukprot:1558-Chlamydomonas_euryale.AAC.3
MRLPTQTSRTCASLPRRLHHAPPYCDALSMRLPTQTPPPCALPRACASLARRGRSLAFVPCVVERMA